MKKTRKKRNKIWEISKEDFIKLVLESNCIADILYKIGYANYSTSHYRRIKERIQEESIPCEHLKRGSNSIWSKSSNLKRKIPLVEILTENSSYSRWSLKKRLFDEGMLEEKCAKCGMGNEWQNEKLALQIDHINGIWNDNRIENLRILCPNCHSQTKTFTSKNTSSGTKPIAKRIIDNEKIIEKECLLDNNQKIKKKYCYNCGDTTTSIKTGLCAKCYAISSRKVIRPSGEELKLLMDKNSLCAIGRMYNVSDNAVRYWAKNYGIIGKK